MSIVGETAKPRRLLLVDDDETFRESLKLSLEQSGYVVVAAPGGRIAQTLLGAEQFDALLTDIRMPDGDGLALVRHTRKTYPDLPLLLMTGFAGVVETQEAHEIGARVFLAKPFDKTELLESLKSCIDRKTSLETAPGTEASEEYFKIAIEDFITGSYLQNDIYIRLSPTKHVRIAHRGDSLPPEQIKKYSTRGIRHLYMTKSDFAVYVGMNLRLTQEMKSSTCITKDRKRQFMKHANEVVLERIYSEELNQECFDDAKTVLDATLSLFSEDVQAMNLLELLESHSDHLYAHSLGVSLYSSMIARQLRWHSAATQSKLSMGGLMHDVGKKEIDRAILDKPRRELTHAELKIYERHCVRGLELLGEIRSMPSDVLLIAQQHHEDCLGQGFPSGLKRQSIHPLARVVAVANAFCNMVLPTAAGPGLRLADALPRMLTIYSQTLDPAVFAGLLKVFKFQVPPHYETELRKKIMD